MAAAAGDDRTDARRERRGRRADLQRGASLAAPGERTRTTLSRVARHVGRLVLGARRAVALRPRRGCAGQRRRRSRPRTASGARPGRSPISGSTTTEMDALRADLEAHEPFSRLLLRRTDAQRAAALHQRQRQAALRRRRRIPRLLGRRPRHQRPKCRRSRPCRRARPAIASCSTARRRRSCCTAAGACSTPTSPPRRCAASAAPTPWSASTC